MEVGDNAAHPVVRGRSDGHGFAGPVDAGLAGAGAEGGEPLGEEALAPAGLDHACVEEHVAVGVAECGKVQGDAAGDDVPGGEFGVGVVGGHEAFAVGVHQDGAFAADSLGDQQGVRVGSGSVAGFPASAGRTMQVGWNWKNSRSATAAPARQARARPSAVATAGLVVWANSWPGSAGGEEDGVAVDSPVPARRGGS